MSDIKRQKKIVISTQRKKLTRKEKKEAEKQRKTPDNSPLLLVIYLLGMTGIFIGLNDMMELSFGISLLVMGYFCVLTTLMWYVNFYHRKRFVFFTLGTVAVTVILVGVMIITVLRSNDISFLYKGFDEMDKTYLVIIMGLMLSIMSYILFALEFVVRKHNLIFLVCAAVVMLGPLVNIRLNMFAITCIVVFQFGFMALNMTDRSYKKIFNVRNRAKTAAVTVAVIAALLLISFVPAVIIEKTNESKMFRQVYQADAYLQDVLMNMDLGINTDFVNGIVSRGNNHQTGNKVMDFYTEKKPDKENMYLPTFYGKEYDGYSWSPAITLGYSTPADQFCYREEFVDNILQTMINEGSMYSEETIEYVSFYQDRYRDFYNDLLQKPVGYDLGGNYYYYNPDGGRLLMRSPENRKNGESVQVDHVSVNTMTNFVERVIPVSIVEYNGKLREFWINENLDCYYKEYNDFYKCFDPVFVDKEEMKNIIYNDGGNPDIIDDESFWDFGAVKEYSSVFTYNCYYNEDYDLYFLISNNLYIEVYNSKDDLDEGKGFSLTSGSFEMVDSYLSDTFVSEDGTRFSAGLLSNIYCSDLVASIYANYGNYGKRMKEIMESGDETYYYVSSNSDETKFFVNYTFWGNSYRFTAPYYSTKSIGDMMFSGEYMGTYYPLDSVDMSEVWDDPNIPEMPMYKRFIDLYERSIKGNYTQCDRKRFPTLSKLCEETPLESLNEVTTFILYTLQNHATYSRTPGAVPFNKETVEYFLFENHRGYCVHYATAAAMMYRMYGIPARYVTGYAVPKSSFRAIDSKIENYWEKSEITDRYAHAWVEIFLTDYGWVPVEMTPSTLGTVSASYPGYDYMEMMRIMHEHGWKFRSVEDYTAGRMSDDNGAAAQGGWNLDIENGWIYAVVGAVVLLAGTVLFFVFRRNYIIRNIDNMNCRRLFDRMITALHFSGTLPDMNGSELDFSEKVCSILPTLDKGEMDRVIDILLIDNYSEKSTDGTQRDIVKEMSKKITQILYENMKWYRKPIYKFIKALI